MSILSDTIRGIWIILYTLLALWGLIDIVYRLRELRLPKKAYGAKPADIKEYGALDYALFNYAPEWRTTCPTCGEPLTLVRKPDDPHESPTGVCSGCGAEVAGLLHVRGCTIEVHIFDLLRDK